MSNKFRLEFPDPTARNIDKIAALFPNCITEAVVMEKSTAEHKTYKKTVNFELFKQILPGDVLEGDEIYEFTCAGKKRRLWR